MRHDLHNLQDRVSSSENDLVWITAANFSKLKKALNNTLTITEYDNVYKSELRFIFSTKILKQLAFWKLLFSDLDIFLDDFQMLKKLNKTNENYLFINKGSGAYHSHNECPFLLSDYRNIQLPWKYSKNKELMTRIRDFANANKSLFNSDPKSFAFEVKDTFGLLEEPTIISEVNSGVRPYKNEDLENIESKVDQLIIKAKLFMNKDQETLDTIKKLGFGSERAINLDISGTIKIWYHNYQKPLYDLLVSYFRVALNPNLTFERSLLEQLYFKPCRHCVKQVR